MVPSRWSSKDVADHSLSIEATHFHWYSQQYPNFSKVPFVLISSDPFLLEVSNRLNSFGRHSIVFNPNTSFAFFTAKFQLVETKKLGDPDRSEMFHETKMIRFNSPLATFLQELKPGARRGELKKAVKAMNLETVQTERLVNGIVYILHGVLPMTFSGFTLKYTPELKTAIENMFSQSDVKEILLDDVKVRLHPTFPDSHSFNWLSIFLDRRNLKDLRCDMKYDDEKAAWKIVQLPPKDSKAATI